MFGMGTGVDPAALAASRPTRGIEPQWTAPAVGETDDHVYVRPSLRLDPFAESRMNVWLDLLVPAG